MIELYKSATRTLGWMPFAFIEPCRNRLKNRYKYDATSVCFEVLKKGRHGGIK